MANTLNFEATGTQDLEFVGKVYVAGPQGIPGPQGDPGPTGATGPAGPGDVNGPASSVDNNLVRYDGTTGKLVQAGANSVLTDAGQLQLPTSGTTGGLVIGTSTFYESVTNVLKTANQLEVSGRRISLTGATNNWINWNTTGVGAPTYTSSSSGTKLLLFPAIGASAADYALGVEASHIWNGVSFAPNTGANGGFKWYGGTTQVAKLGIFSATTVPSLGLGIDPTTGNGALQLPASTTLATGGIRWGTDAWAFRQSAGVIELSGLKIGSSSTSGYVWTATDTAGNGSWQAAPGSGSGTVTTVSVVSANGLAGTVANASTTPAITLSTTVTGILKGNGTSISAATAGTDYTTPSSTETVTNKNLTSGTNTFPTFNQNTTGSAASFTGSLVGDVTGTQGATVVGKINGVALSGLATGILKNTTTTGVPSIAVAADFPTLNQNTTGSAATLTTSRTFQTNLASTSTASFNGSANVTPGVSGTLAVTNGGTGTATAFTANSAIFAGASGVYSQDNANYNYNSSSKTLTLDSVGTANALHIGLAPGTSNAVVGGAGVEFVGTNNTLGGYNLILGNKHSGTQAFVDLFMQNDLADATGTHFAVLNLNSSTYNDTTYGTFNAIPNQLALYGTDGPTVVGSINATSAGYFSVVTGGASTTNERLRVTSAGVVNILANQGKTTLNLTDTTAGTGLTIGGDTNIYRSVANHLATDDLLDLSNVSTIASAATGVAIGDKISLYQTTTALAFGIGIQSSRTVLYVPSGGGVGIRASSTGTYRSGGTDAITLLATGVATFTGKVTAPSLQITTSPTSGYVLTSDATGNATWQAAPGGGSGITRSVTVTSGSYTAGSTASTDYIYLVAGAHNATLPTASGNSNRYTFKNNHSASVTVTRAGADTVEGATSISVSPGNSVDLISNGTSAWYVI